MGPELSLSGPTHPPPQPRRTGRQKRLATTILVEGGIESFADWLPQDTDALAAFDDGDAQHLSFRAAIFACGSALPERPSTPNRPL